MNSKFNKGEQKMMDEMHKSTIVRLINHMEDEIDSLKKQNQALQENNTKLVKENRALKSDLEKLYKKTLKENKEENEKDNSVLKRSWLRGTEISKQKGDLHD